MLLPSTIAILALALLYAIVYIYKDPEEKRCRKENKILRSRIEFVTNQYEKSEVISHRVQDVSVRIMVDYEALKKHLNYLDTMYELAKEVSSLMSQSLNTLLDKYGDEAKEVIQKNIADYKDLLQQIKRVQLIYDTEKQKK